jgi:hypothetical protein
MVMTEGVIFKGGPVPLYEAVAGPGLAEAMKGSFSDCTVLKAWVYFGSVAALVRT